MTYCLGKNDDRFSFRAGRSAVGEGVGLAEEVPEATDTDLSGVSAVGPIPVAAFGFLLKSPILRIDMRIV